MGGQTCYIAGAPGIATGGRAGAKSAVLRRGQPVRAARCADPAGWVLFHLLEADFRTGSR
jgi:hypothetical protein